LQLIADAQTVDELAKLYKRTKNAVKFTEQFTARKNELSQSNISQ
jgi:hypothetical protein